MGQQQLLLLVLGIVIVGIAVVAGIQAFSEGKLKAEQDAAVSDAMRIISDLQAWYLKPVAFGGGGETVAYWDKAEFSSIGIRNVNEEGQYETLNGCFGLESSSTGATVSLYLKEAGDCADETFATAVVTSASATDGISWTYTSASTGGGGGGTTPP